MGYIQELGAGPADIAKKMTEKVRQVSGKTLAKREAAGGGSSAPWYKASWVIPAGIGVAAIIAFMVMKKRKKGGAPAALPVAPKIGG